MGGCCDLVVFVGCWGLVLWLLYVAGLVWFVWLLCFGLLSMLVGLIVNSVGSCGSLLCSALVCRLV